MQSNIRQDKARQDNTTQYMTIQYNIRLDKARQDKTIHYDII